MNPAPPAYSFDLITEPFIPCVLADGQLHDLSLRDTLRRAPKIREIRGETPLVTAALHRFLLALLHRVFGPSGLMQWQVLWQAKQWDADRLAPYLNKFRERFDLFHPHYPFYQTPRFPGDNHSTASRLTQSAAAGNNATLFDHSTDESPVALAPAAAARFLIAHQAFAVGGGKSPTGYTTHGPLIQGAVVVPTGQNLFETLMFNLLPYDAEHPMPAAEDAPAWELDPKARPRSATPRGYLDYLTWQTRLLKLEPEEGAGGTVVRFMAYGQGRELKAAEVLDPMMVYRRHEERGWLALRLSEDRALWRDSAALFQLSQPAEVRPPASFNWLAQLVTRGVLRPDNLCSLAVYGVCSDRAKVFFWRHETLPLPLAYLANPELVANLATLLATTEEIAKTLRTGAWHLGRRTLFPGQDPARPLGKMQKADLEKFLGAAAPTRDFWASLETDFRRLLVDLPGPPEQQSRLVAGWICQVAALRARRTFDALADNVGQSARALRAAAEARASFHLALSRITSLFKEIVHGSTP